MDFKNYKTFKEYNKNVINEIENNSSISENQQIKYIEYLENTENFFNSLEQELDEHFDFYDLKNVIENLVMSNKYNDVFHKYRRPIKKFSHTKN